MKKMALAGVAASLALGLVVGLAARPELASGEQRPMPAVPQGPAPAGYGY